MSFDLNRTYLTDALNGLKQCPDNYFNLIIIDPPYGNVVNASWDKNKSPMTTELISEKYEGKRMGDQIYQKRVSLAKKAKNNFKNIEDKYIKLNHSYFGIENHFNKGVTNE